MALEGDRVAAALDAGEIQTIRAIVPDLYRYASRLTGGDRWLAEDLVQEACLAMIRQRQAQPTYEFTVGWFVVVVRRRFLDQLRKARREDRRLALADEGDLAAEDADWGAVSGADAMTLLAELPADQRVALVLRYLDDLPVQEVADLMERSLAATESLLARGRRQLARRVKGGRDG